MSDQNTPPVSMDKRQVSGQLALNNASPAVLESLKNLIPHALKSDFVFEIEYASTDEARLSVARRYLEFAARY